MYTKHNPSLLLSNDGEDEANGFPLLQFPRQPLMPIPHTPPTPMSANELACLERMHRVNALTSVMHAEAGIAKEWLNYRYPGERNIRIDFQAESRQRGWLSGRGEILRATLEVNIW